jgi:hypothetical protein
MTWNPISLDELRQNILNEENDLNGDVLFLWRKIKINPRKWHQDPWGNEGGGFWVVGVIGSMCLYYNDIEEGFNWSVFEEYGEIKEYRCEQDTIGFAMVKLFEKL